MTAPEAPSIDLTALPEVPIRRAPGSRDRVMAHALAADVARVHGETLLHTALRYSYNRDDAHDAYQRAMERLLEHAATIDRAKALNWMQVVVRREAGVLRKQHGRTVALDGEDVDEAFIRLSPAPEEQLDAIDLAKHAGEALSTLKESEAQALCLRAQGMSYEEIADLYGWSYTKVNRAVTEGRKAFVKHYKAVESGVVCGDTAELIERYVAGTLKPRVALKVRAHLVRCSGCRALMHAERGADHALRALLPPVFVAAAGSRKTGALGWMHDQILGPVGHVAGRLTPAADHLTGAKLGVVAASAIALAGSGVAVEQHATRHHTPPKLLHTTLVSDDHTPSGTPVVGVNRVVDRAISQATTIRKRAEARAAAKARHAATVKRKAAAAKARKAGNAREFVGSAGEFASTTEHSATQAKKQAARAAAATPAASASAPATQVDVGGGNDSSSVTVTPEPSSSSRGSGDTVSDEFGN